MSISTILVALVSWHWLQKWCSEKQYIYIHVGLYFVLILTYRMYKTVISVIRSKQVDSFVMFDSVLIMK